MLPGLNNLGRQSLVVGGPPVLTFKDEKAHGAGGTSIQITDCDIGAASSDRYVLVCVSTSFTTVTGVTIGGTSANLVLNDGSNNTNDVRMFELLVTTGTTATIIATLASSVNKGAMQVYTLTGVSSISPTDTAVVDNSTGVMTLDSDIPSGDSIAVAVSSVRSKTATATWVGLSNENIIIDPNTFQQETADFAGSSAETPRTMSIDWSGSDAGAAIVAVFQ